jgi:molybdopterin-guanine dinucleotide biosynthesis protein A
MMLPGHRSRKGFILAGGKSSRMGADKALLDFRGRTLLQRAVDLLREVSLDFAIVGDPAKYASYGTIVQDLFLGCGPLAGIHAALQDSAAELNFALAVDLPFVSSELVQFLFDVAENCDATAIVPRTGRGWQPLCAVYRPDFADVADEALRAGKYKIDRLFAAIKVRIIEENELAAAGFTERNFFNVNAPEDLRSARQSSGLE